MDSVDIGNKILQSWIEPDFEDTKPHSPATFQTRPTPKLVVRLVW
jgi:hypothetical protein